MGELAFIEETLRDGQQSLWANRMTTASMLPIAPVIDECGFQKINVLSASAFESCIMYLNEDPWERLRLLRRFMPKTPITILIRGRMAFGWRRYPNDVIELFFKCLKKMGFQWVVIFDGLNDMRNLAWHFRVGREIGLRVTGSVAFALSPVHTDEYFAEKARELVRLGVDNVALGDASGLLTPERTSSLVPAVRKAIGDKVQLEFGCHDGTGLASACCLEAMKSGINAMISTSLPLSYGNSIPPTVEMVYHARQMGLDVRLDDRRLKEIDDYFYWVAYKEKKPIGRPVNFDPIEYEKYAGHQIPGGMMSHLVSQLKALGLTHLLPQVLEEAGRVRQEIGYPVMVTPFSQFVGVQAVFNVIEGERYRTVPWDLRLYARGFYGQLAAPFDPNVLDRIVGDEPPIDPTEVFSEPLINKMKAEQGPFKSDEELLMVLFNSRPTLEKFYKNKKPIEVPALMRQPLSVLIRELGNKGDLKLTHIEKGPLRISVRNRAGSSVVITRSPENALKIEGPRVSLSTDRGVKKSSFKPAGSPALQELRKLPAILGNDIK